MNVTMRMLSEHMRAALREACFAIQAFADLDAVKRSLTSLKAVSRVAATCMAGS